MPAGGIAAVMLTAAVLFASTNADDIVVLTVLNVSSRAAGHPRPWHIWAGQDAGFSILAGSAFAAHPGITRAAQRWGHWAVPVAFILVGVYILAKTGALS